MVSLRPAKQADRDQILEVHVSAIRELCATHYTADQIEAWAGRLRVDSYDRVIRERKLLVAVAGDVVVGFGQLDSVTGEIEAIYVRPSAARRGVGSGLLRELEAIARSARLQELFLDASLNAVAFYERAGFLAVDARNHQFESGVGIPCVRMVKLI